jgi:methionine-rich copper-binding protein CopC
MRTEPAANAEVAAFDGRVRAWFSGNVSERSPSLLVMDSKGTRVDNRDLSLRLGDRSELSVTTRPLPPGSYVVRYRVLTADGLVVSGIFRFIVKF